MPNLEKLHKLRRLVATSNRLGNGRSNDLNFLTSLSNATDLEILALSMNNFGGNLPQSLGNLSTSLATLFLDNNRISGRIPEGISRLINLEGLELWRNQLTGEIPYEIGKLQKLKSLILNRNQLTGMIPSSFGNFSSLLELRVAKNNLQGSIPSSLGSFQMLQILDISENNLNGTIPQKIFDFPSLSMFLDMSNNQLVGSIPVEIGNLENVGMIDISHNRFSGEIPSTIGNCKALQNLLMRKNMFSGTIPASISSLKGLRRLDFAFNNLSGEIPRSLGSLNLIYLNFSFNDFEGGVPDEGIFTNASVVSVLGNPKLCGGIQELKLPRCSITSKPSKKFTSTLAFKLIVSIVSSLFGIILIIVLVLLYFFKKSMKKKVSSDSSMTLVSSISYQSIVRASDRFSSENLLGTGGYGSVYKGILEDGTIVAIKVFNLERRGAAKSFLAECEALRNIKHRNLVKVLSACSGIDNHGNDFKALIYEFVENGNLDDWIHSKRETGAESRRSLSIYQRLKIAIDVAHALEYLHNQCQTSVVHCDLKPSNVLLDNDMVAHVADFGLSRILSQENQNITTSSSILKGTIGYAPPEYGRQGEVTTHGDVYSFGILVLEMFTGIRPTDDIFVDGHNLHTLVEAAWPWPDKLAAITDQEILEEIKDRTNNGCSNNSSKIYQELEELLISILDVGIRCSKDSARERMNFSDAVAMLLSSRGKIQMNLSS